MRLRQHSTSNDVLGAPAGVPHEQCTPAPVTRIEYADGTRCVRTYWQPSPEEMAAIAAGRPVWLQWWGISMAPACLGVEGVGDDLAGGGG